MESIRALFKRAGLPFPGSAIYLRAFKQEGVLELWAASQDSSYRLLRSYTITKQSGTPGPKRREGDHQVPEGFYKIDRFNPKSLFHLSLGLNYPNASDLVRSDPREPGTDIFIHGGTSSIGCLPIEDDPIEELYLIADLISKKSGQPIPVHLFPGRMSGETWEKMKTAHPELVTFWAELEPAYRYFEKLHRVPDMRVTAEGAYQIAREK